jgi:two-component system cell cycle response regulator CpdR
MTAHQPGIRVMFITGFAAVTMQDARLTPHQPKVLTKPFHLRHLVSEIEALLSQ